MNKIKTKGLLSSALLCLSATALMSTAQANGESSGWTFGSLVEIEAAHVSPEVGESESDIVLATVEAVASAELTEQITVDVGIKYEEDDTDLEIDIGTITYNFKDTNLNVVMGQFYLPFGAYETIMISDPLTKELGETRESSMMLSYEHDVLAGQVYIFNGDVNKDAESNVDTWGFNVGYATEALSASLGYISNLTDSDAMQGALESTDVDDSVGGFTASVVASLGPLVGIVEYTTALDPINDVAFSGAEPTTTNIELDYNFTIGGREMVIGLAHQTSDESLALELPETRTLIGFGTSIGDGLGLAIELAHDQDYDINEGGSGESSDSLVVQFAAEF